MPPASPKVFAGGGGAAESLCCRSCSSEASGPCHGLSACGGGTAELELVSGGSAAEPSNSVLGGGGLFGALALGVASSGDEGMLTIPTTLPSGGFLGVAVITVPGRALDCGGLSAVVGGGDLCAGGLFSGGGGGGAFFTGEGLASPAEQAGGGAFSLEG